MRLSKKVAMYLSFIILIGGVNFTIWWLHKKDEIKETKRKEEEAKKPENLLSNMSVTKELMKNKQKNINKEEVTQPKEIVTITQPEQPNPLELKPAPEYIEFVFNTEVPQKHKNDLPQEDKHDSLQNTFTHSLNTNTNNNDNDLTPLIQNANRHYQEDISHLDPFYTEDNELFDMLEEDYYGQKYPLEYFSPEEHEYFRRKIMNQNDKQEVTTQDNNDSRELITQDIKDQNITPIKLNISEGDTTTEGASVEKLPEQLPRGDTLFDQMFVEYMESISEDKNNLINDINNIPHTQKESLDDLVTEGQQCKVSNKVKSMINEMNDEDNKNMNENIQESIQKKLDQIEEKEVNEEMLEYLMGKNTNYSSVKDKNINVKSKTRRMCELALNIED